MSVIAADFPTHWKTKLLSELLEDPQAGMLLVRLWCHCHARKEDTFKMNSEQLASVCGWPIAHAEKLDRVLQNCRWIERPDPETMHVLQWREYNRRLFSNAENGGKSHGRPRTHPKPNGNPTKTHGLPTANPSLTDGHPVDNPSETHSARGVEESREEPPPLPRASAPVGASEGSGQSTERLEAIVDQTTARICAIFQRKKYVGQDARASLCHQAVAGVLPLEERDWLALERFYAERKNGAPTDKQWRTSADAVAKELPAEVEKAHAWLRQHEIAVPASAPGEKNSAPEATEPPRWLQWFTEQYPHILAPISYWQLPDSERSAFQLWQRRNPEGPAE